MYPLQCVAGFNVPARAGKYDVAGFTAAIEDPTADSYIAIIDDPDIDQSGKAGKIIGSIEPPTEQKYIIARVDKDASATEGTLSWEPLEPIKTRYGTSLSFTNIKQGSFCLYVR